MTKPPKVGAGSGNRRPSAAERALWDAATRDVPRHVPLPDEGVDGSPTPVGEKMHETGKPRKAGKTRSNAAQVVVAPPAPPGEADLSHGAGPGLDTRTRLRLRRGQIDIQRRLDLHGMTQVKAQDALTAFLAAAQADDLRSVLVITGKGLTRQGETGVLRREVPRWLNQPPLRSWVRAFSHAAPRDGGEGALYVLLRRKR